MIRKFEIGPVLSSTFSIYFANFVPFFTMGVLLNIPTILLQYLIYSGDLFASSDPKLLLGVPFGLLILSFLLGNLVTGAISFGVFQYLRGKKPSIGQCITRGLVVLLPVIGVAILLGLIVGLGLMLCLIPGIIFYIIFCTAVPVAVVEKPGVLASLGRSKELTSGNRWPVFAIILVLSILNGAVGTATQFAFASVGEFGVIGQQLIAVVLNGIMSTALVVIYYHLRASKESIDVESIAKVFD